MAERWMVAQLHLERQYFQHLGTTAGRRLRLLSLLELDTLTQLPDSGLPLPKVAGLLEIDLPVARAVVTRLARRGLVRRIRGSDRTWAVHRTDKADDVIRMLQRTQAGLIGTVLVSLDTDLRDRLMRLMADGALSLSSGEGRPTLSEPGVEGDRGRAATSTEPDWVI